MNKKVLVIRLGAIGDLIMITPLLKQLKEDEYHVTVCVKPHASAVLLHNPYIDKLIKDNPPNDGTLDQHWEKMGEGYDKVINLSGSIEGSLMPRSNSELGQLSKEERHEKCNKNFYDATMEWAGYRDKKGLCGELFFSRSERRMAKKYREKFAGQFVVLWSLSGSSIHKAYPYTFHVISALTQKYSDMVFITTGDEICQILEQDLVNNPQVKCHSGDPIRKSMALVEHVDCVVGPDTGMMHAAGCYDMPKILLMSANTEENISKYWSNQVTIHGDCDCYPCHKLVYNASDCVLDAKLEIPKCMAALEPKKVFREIEKVYHAWAREHVIVPANIERSFNYGSL
jgi:ADP-heptose:LPS heptosyltransferase